jgi:hypothetical protein
MIATDNYGSGGVHTAIVADIKLIGPDYLGIAPYNNPDGLAYRGPALNLDAVVTGVQDTEIQDWRGWAILLGSTTGAYSQRIAFNDLRGCYAGVLVTSDLQLFGNWVVGMRDYGWELAANFSNSQSIANHLFGMNKCVYGNNHPGHNSVGDTHADANIGVHLEGTSTGNFTGCFSQHHTISNYIVTDDCSFVNCRVSVAGTNASMPGIAGQQIAGYTINGKGNTILGGSIGLAEYLYTGVTYDTFIGSTAVILKEGAYDNRIDTKVWSKTWPTPGNGGASGSSDYADVVLHVRGAAKGNRVHINIPFGFATEWTNCRLMKIDTGFQDDFVGNDITFEGPYLGTSLSHLQSYFEIASGGIDSTNTVRVRNTRTGVTVTLSSGTVY